MEIGRRTLPIAILFIILLNWNFDKCFSKTFKIAFLAPASFSNYHINSENSVDGLKLALRSVLKNPNILSGHKIAVKFFDTKCSAQSAMTIAMHAKTSFNPDVIVGPPCQEEYERYQNIIVLVDGLQAIDLQKSTFESLKMVAQLGTYWNLPVLNWYHTGNEFNSAKKYPTLVRMIPPLHLLSKAMIHVLNQYKLTRISVIFTGIQPWTLLEQPIREEAAIAGVEIHGVYQVTSNMSTTAFTRMFAHIKRTAQAVVMACSFPDVRNLMLSAASAGMANGQYTFLHIDPQIYSDNDLSTKVLSDGGWKRGDTFDTQARLAYESLLHIIINPITEKPGQLSMYPKSKYSDYVKLAVVEGQFSHLEWELPQGLLPDVYSAYLCDGVVVWSGLVDMLFKMGKNYRDGKLIAEYVKRITAKGATGTIGMTENLDRLGEIYILDMQTDGKFQPIQNLKFDKNDRYSITNINPSSLPKTKSPEGILIDRTRHPRPGQPFQGRRFQSTVAAVQTTILTTTTSSTTTTTSTTPKPTTRTTSLPTTASRNRVKNVMSQVGTVADTFITANPPTQPTDVYTTPRPKVDPHLHNFDVKRKKKKKIFAKAAKLLNQLRQTGDPNVAAFLRLALERLVVEEELIPPHLLHRYKTGRHKRGNVANSLANKKVVSNRKVRSTTAEPTTTPPVVTPPAPETTQSIETTAEKTKRTSAATTTAKYQKTQKLTTKIPITTASDLPQTEIMPQNKRKQKVKIAKIRQGKNIGQKAKYMNSKPRRKLRERWSQERPSTTPLLTTTDATDPPEPEAEPFMTQNMLSSILNKLTSQVMSKVTGEIQTLKKSFEKVVQLNSLSKTEKPTSGTTSEITTPTATTAKRVIKQALIEIKEAQPVMSKSTPTTTTIATSSNRATKPKHKVSTAPPSTYITTRRTLITTTPQPTTAVQTTENIIEETTTDLFMTEKRKRRPDGKQKGKARGSISRRRLRQNWYNDVQETTPFVPTTDPTEPPEYEVLMAQNMISSLVDKVAHKMFGKMNKEIQTLKQSMEKMQSAASKENLITSTLPDSTPKPIQTASYKIPEHVEKATRSKTGINESLIKEISANVLSKLNGVSWLTKNSIQLKQESVKSTSKALVGQGNILDFSKTPLTTASLTEQTTTQPKISSSRQPATPKMVGSWVSELPFMQMLGIDAIPTKRIKISQQKNSSNETVPAVANPSKLSNTVSSINEPSRLNKILSSKRNYPFNLPKRDKLSKKETKINKDSKVFKAGPLRKNLISIANDPFALGNSVPLTRQLRMKPVTKTTKPKPTTARVPLKKSKTLNSKIGNMSVVNLKKTTRNETKSSSVGQNPAGESRGSITIEAIVPKPKVGNMNIVNLEKTNQREVKQSSVKYEPKVTQAGQQVVDIKSLVENITESVMGEVQSQMDTLNVSVKDGKIMTTSTTTTTTTKPILSLRQKFRSSSSSRDRNFPRVGIITANSKNDLVKQVSEAVIMTLTHNETHSNEQGASNSPGTNHDKHKEKQSSASKSGKSTSIVDEITSKVYGKMNAKINALRRSVSKLQQNMEPPDVDPPEHGGGRGHHMMGGYGAMMPPNMPPNPPFGMLGMPPYTYEIVGPKQGTGPPKPPKTSAMPGAELTTAPPNSAKGETLVVKFDLSQMSKMPWMYPVGGWINNGMPPPPQQNMWGPPSQPRSPWWS